MRIRRFRSVVALVSLLVLILTTMAPGVSAAAGTTMTDSDAVALLQSYGIVKGNPDGTLDLDSKLTRAQAAALFVRVEGVDGLAPTMADMVPFTDAVGHWAAGEITLANRLGLMKGDGNGTFRPNADITYAEVLTVLLRIVQQEPSGPWSPQGIYAAAASLGFAPAGVSPSAPAIRGKMFTSMAVAISKVPLPTGETALHKYIDQTPPVLTLGQVPQSTSDQSVVISGTAQGAQSVTVDGQSAQFDKTTGRFTATVSLDEGDNNIVVEAVDAAGNKASDHVTVERLSQAASLDISGPNVIKVGTSQKLDIVAKDRNGQSVALDGLTAQVTGGVATFDTARKTLTAGNQVGRGVLTLQLGTARKSFTFDVTDLSPRADHLVMTVNDGKSPTVGKEATVKVQVMDANNRVVTDDYWRSIRLTASGSDATVRVAQSTQTTTAGVATFQVTGTSEGAATLTVTSNGLDDASTDVQFVTSTRIVLTATPTTLQPNGTATTTIKAYLQNDTGGSVSNSSSSDININLTATGTDGYLVDSYITIPKGASSGGSDTALYRVGVLTGAVQITGTLSSTQHYSVQSLSIPVAGPKSPVKMQIVGPTATQPPNGSPVPITIQMVDSSNAVVPYGSYAFKVRVTTSNGETISNGLPDGVTLNYPGLNYGPVGDDSSVVIGRTYQGKATLNLTYDKSGMVTLTPVLLGAVNEAYHPSLGVGPASASTGLSTEAEQVQFAGTPVKVALTVDSVLGTEKPAGAVKAGGSMKVHARVVDASGAVVPTYSGTATITRSADGDKVTRFGTTSADTLRVTISKGEAQFDVLANTSVGFDVYSASVTGLTSSSVTVAVRKDKPLTPTILAIRGVTEGDSSPVEGYIGPDADYMDIQLASMSSPEATEPTYWVAAKVYRKGSTTAIVSGVPLDLLSDMPTIHIPKSSLTTAGNAVYEVVINDGAGDSDRSPDLGLSNALNALVNSSYKLTAAWFDAATTKLTLTTSGLATTGIVHPDMLTIVKGTNRLALDGAEVKSVASTSVVLQLNSIASSLDPDIYNGSVEVQALAGWYTNSDGGYVANKNDGVDLEPMAVITGGTFDKVNRRLTLNGVGLKQGTLNLAQIQIGGVSLRVGTGTSYDQYSSTASTDTAAIITLSPTTLSAIDALTGPSIPITAGVGWLKVGSGSSPYQAQALAGTARQLYVNVSVTRAQYFPADDKLTITGQGFTGATLDPSKLKFRRSGSSAATTYRLGADTTATTVDDDTIEIHLGATDAAYFEATTGFGGRQVVMTSDENWLQDDHQRQAAPISSAGVLFSVSTR